MSDPLRTRSQVKFFPSMRRVSIASSAPGFESGRGSRTDSPRPPSRARSAAAAGRPGQLVVEGKLDRDAVVEQARVEAELQFPGPLGLEAGIAKADLPVDTEPWGHAIFLGGYGSEEANCVGRTRPLTRNPSAPRSRRVLGTRSEKMARPIRAS